MDAWQAPGHVFCTGGTRFVVRPPSRHWPWLRTKTYLQERTRWARASRRGSISSHNASSRSAMFAVTA